MKNHRPEQHLTPDELLAALVDANELAAGRQSHFKHCPSCQRDLQMLERRFERIGKMAQSLSPSPSRPFRLPEKKITSSARHIKAVFATGLAAALVLVLSIWGSLHFGHQVTLPEMTAQSLEADRRLMQEVDALVRNALPKPYRQLAAVSEPGPELDEDLINRIVPSIEEGDDDTMT